MGALVWVDISQGIVHLTSADGLALARFEAGIAVGAALPTAGGGWLLAAADGLSALSVEGNLAPVLPFLEQDSTLRCNDAKCDPEGRAFVGTMALDGTPGRGSLVRVDAGPVAATVRTGLTIGNGRGWSPDGRTMYHVDTPQPIVQRFAYDPISGDLGAELQPSDVAVRPGGEAGPDGLCTDDTGCVWVAIWGQGEVHRYTPRGELDLVVEVPARRVTSCAFGGADGGRLFVTTAAGATGADLGGGLFAVDGLASGPPAMTWRDPGP